MIITFLAQDASKVVASCISLGDVSATVEPLLTRTDVEVWTATVNAIGFVPLGSAISTGQIILELSSLTQKTVVEIEIQTTPEPKFTSSVNAAVPLSISRTSAPQTPMHRSLRDTVGQSMGNDYSMYQSVALAPKLATPSGRHHSEYVYDPTRPIPESYMNEVRSSILEVSMRASKREQGNAANASTFDIEKALQDP